MLNSSKKKIQEVTRFWARKLKKERDEKEKLKASIQQIIDIWHSYVIRAMLTEGLTKITVNKGVEVKELNDRYYLKPSWCGKTMYLELVEREKEDGQQTDKD